MKSLDQFFQSEIVQALGWMILHSIWQGLLIVILLTVALVVLRKHSSQIRYLIGYVALLSLALCSLGTFFLSLPSNTVFASESPMLIGGEKMDIAAISVSETTTAVVGEASLWQSFVKLLEANLPWITIVWMLGVLLLSLRFLAELAYIQRLKYQPGSLAVDAFQEAVNRLATDMGIRQAVALKENFRVDSPMVIGFIKPVILVPIGLLSRLEPAQVESILAHELAHIKRHDYIFNLLQSLVEILLFFNPATWWISAQIRSEREYCCDEMAIAQTGNQIVFVQTLAKLEEYRRLPGNMALAFNSRRNGGVLGRIQRIVNSEEPFRVPYKLFWSCLILLGSLGLFAFQSPSHAGPINSDLIEQDSLNQAVKLEDASLDTMKANEEAVTTLEAPAEDTVRIKNSQIPLSRQDQQKATEQSTNITKENSQIAPVTTAGFNLNNLDTVPKEVRELKQQMMKLAKDFQEQEMVFQQEVREIQKQKLQLEMEIQQQQNKNLKDLYEMEKKSQNAQLSQNLKLKELELEYSVLENQIVESIKEIQQLTQKISNAKSKGSEVDESLLKQKADLSQKIKDLEKKKRAHELTQKRAQVEAEKEMQTLHNRLWQQKEEAQLAENDKQLQVLELEQKLQELQFQNQMTQSERQNQMQLLQMQIEQAMQKWQEK